MLGIVINDVTPQNGQTYGYYGYGRKPTGRKVPPAAAKLLGIRENH